MPRAELVRDLSWNLVDTVVLHVRNADSGAASGDAIVKAAGPGNSRAGHHIGRELDAHQGNWLVDGAELRVIDLGRFAFRPAATDLTRLSAQQWRQAPACEDAFFDGYGADPREPSHWLLARACEAIGTAAWAHQVGDEPFERQGHRMIAEVLAAAASFAP